MLIEDKLSNIYRVYFRVVGGFFFDVQLAARKKSSYTTPTLFIQFKAVSEAKSSATNPT